MKRYEIKIFQERLDLNTDFEDIFKDVPEDANIIELNLQHCLNLTSHGMAKIIGYKAYYDAHDKQFYLTNLNHHIIDILKPFGLLEQFTEC